jgi:hypothetical protein
MFHDNKKPNDQTITKFYENSKGKAKDNITQLTRSMEGQETQIAYRALDVSTDAKYDKKADTIFIAKDYQQLHEQEPDLFEPLLEHERVHAEYKSDPPVDERSLQSYIDEEMKAYRAEYDAWQRVKSQYTAPEARRNLCPAGQELVARYEFKMNRIEQSGWSDYRRQLEQEYRQRMEVSR